LDDGKSDPVSIAYGIAPQRGELHAQLTNIMVSHNITENGQIAMRERMKSGEVQMITSALPAFRAARNRSGPTAGPPPSASPPIDLAAEGALPSRS